MLVLGVDPGSRVTGYGLVEKRANRVACVRTGTIGLPGRLPFYERIHGIYRSMVDLMSHHRPDEMAIEDVFFSKNVQSALKIGHARGAVLIAAAQCQVRIFEYTPLQIKKAVVGYGSATKEQVRYMIRQILRLQTDPPLDASDALAAAVCHLNWSRFKPKADGRL